MSEFICVPSVAGSMFSMSDLNTPWKEHCKSGVENSSLQDSFCAHAVIAGPYLQPNWLSNCLYIHSLLTKWLLAIHSSSRYILLVSYSKHYIHRIVIYRIARYNHEISPLSKRCR